MIFPWLLLCHEHMSKHVCVHSGRVSICNDADELDKLFALAKFHYILFLCYRMHILISCTVFFIALVFVKSPIVLFTVSIFV